MKGIYACWVAMTIALAACSEKGKNNQKEYFPMEEEKLPVVAHTVSMDGEELLVCELDLLKDTIDLPLSYWVENVQIIRLDGSDEALVGMGPVYVSDNYIMVGRHQSTPCKLFRKDGTYIGNVGSIGQGPGEYTMVYDAQIDEKAGHIYLLPWNAKSIYVYSLEGEYLKDIPLNKKYEDLVVPKGLFKVDAEKNRVAMVLLPFDYLPVVAWIQDMEGNVLHEVKDDHLKLKPDFSNEVLSTKYSENLDVQIFTFWEMKKDTLYHLKMDNGELSPRFTMDFGKRDIMMHTYHEFCRHYLGTLTVPKQVGDNMYSATNEAYFMVDKETKKGTFFRVRNDFMDASPIPHMPWHFKEGYYTELFEPSILKERIEKSLKENQGMEPERREYWEKLFSSIDEDDNNYIFVGNLKTEY